MNLIASISAIAAFVGWAQLVKPLHVVETFIGLGIATVVFIAVKRLCK